MFVVRPVIRHFLLWIALAPCLLIEARALQRALDQVAMTNGGQARRVVARVTAYRDTANDLELRYQFQPPGDGAQYSASDMLGRRDLWTRVTPEAWSRARRQGDRIDVLYLPWRPWVNQPVGVQGSPLVDSLGAWLIFLIIDLFWLSESFLIARNYLRCLAAAERRQRHQRRFWRSVPVPPAGLQV